MQSIKYIKLKGEQTKIPLAVIDENVEITDATVKTDNQGNDITINTLAKAVNEVTEEEINSLFD